MGIRIHKALGWGWNFKKHIPEWFDPSKFADVENVSDYVETHIDELMNILIRSGDFFAQEKSPKSFMSMTNVNLFRRLNVFHASYDDSKYLISCPLYANWYRFDDDIDYQESNRVARDKWKQLDFSPFPFLAKVVRKTNACKSLPETIDAGYYNQLIGRFDKKTKPLLESQEEVDLYIDSYRPLVPSFVHVMLHMSGCISNWEEAFDSIRPAIMTWWM